MAANIRTFIGIPFPETPAIAAMLRELQGIGRNVRPTPPEQLHLTLKFLGETPRDSVSAVRNALIEIAKSAAQHSITFVGLGAFPNAQRPTVLWAGLRPEDELRRMASALDLLLEPLGFVPEARPYHPHLTLARVNGPVPGLTEFLAGHAATPFGGVVAGQLTLYQSESGPAGSHYTELGSSPLRAS